MSERRRRVLHEFVDFIPDRLEDGLIYISVRFATAVHNCCCGCGREVVTPFSPTDWKLVFDGETVSLDPSIGNWSYPCQSHYWISRNRVIWSRRFTRSQIEAIRAIDRAAKDAQFQEGKEPAASEQGGPKSGWRVLLRSGLRRLLPFR